MFLLLSAIPTLNFAAMFLYIASAPRYLVDLLGVSTYGFAWLFVPLIGGIMSGAILSGQLAGRRSPHRTTGLGYAFLVTGAAFNLLVAAFVPPSVPWHVLPLFVFAMDMSTVMPSLTLLMLDLFPTMRGLVPSLAGFVQFCILRVQCGNGRAISGAVVDVARGWDGNSDSCELGVVDVEHHWDAARYMTSH